MTIKRIVLIILTFFAIVKIFLSLGNSLTEPQIQSQLELYQTNFVLHGVELKSEKLDIDSPKTLDDFNNVLNTLFGQEPYLNAQKQYEKAKQNANITIDNYQKQLTVLNSNFSAKETAIKSVEKSIENSNIFINKINLNLGILEAQQGNIEEAIKIWKELPEKSSIAPILIEIWQNNQSLPPNTELQIIESFKGWFRYRVLHQYYKLTDQNKQLIVLESNEQETAQIAVFKLLLLSTLPALGGLIGFGLIIFLIIQLFIKKDQAILAINQGIKWETPWDGETVWFVFIIGFFTVQQIILPFSLSSIFSIFSINPSSFNIRQNALYVLTTYVLMTVAGLLVLYYSIKNFFPLPDKQWFNFKGSKKWFLWGIGGYLVALPLVLIISLINQIFWQGQGGSNDLLFLALQAQDKLALSIFFFTASIAAPFFEEIMFRGFLLSSLTKYVPVWGAILISAFIFAVAHLSLSEVLPLMMLGIILGFVYTRSRNLLAPMLVHSIWNSGTLIGLFILGSGVN